MNGDKCLCHAVVDTRVYDRINMFSSDRRREC